jgi:ferredoxin
MLLLPSLAWSAERFPPPEFVETEHEVPPVNPYLTEPRAEYMVVVDVLVLIAAIALASWLALKKRSRKGLVLVTIFSVGYFGFFRLGCVCPIGATQNVSQGIFDPSYIIPLAVLLFFLIPILFTMFFGRTFCAAVCPLGAVQELVAFKPVKVPRWLASALGLGGWVVLVLGVLLAALGAMYPICRYDPIVPFFRLGAAAPILVFGIALLVLGVFVARPYCRFLCPLGAIFRVMSPMAKYHVTITPEECIQCRLCEEACPYGAIDVPTESDTPRTQGKIKLGLILLAAPLVILLGIGFGYLAGGGELWGAKLGKNLARTHYTVRLQERVAAEEAGLVEGTTDETDSFRQSGKALDEAVAELNQQADAIRADFRIGAAIAGGVLGLVIACKLVGITIRRRREDYVPNRSLCMACGRCYSSCPIEMRRLGKFPEAKLPSQEENENK